MGGRGSNRRETQPELTRHPYRRNLNRHRAFNRQRSMKSVIKILGVSAISFAALAQDKPAPGTNPPLRQIPPTRAQRFDRTTLDLTPEQRTKVDEINRAYATNATPLFSRLGTARRELEMKVNDDTYDEAGIRAKAKEIADLEGELAILRAKRYSKFRAFLAADQARRFNSGAPIARPFQPSLHEGQTPPPVSTNK